MAILDEELKTYEQKKEELLRNYKGKYVLIKGSELVDIFETEKDAVRIGIEKFGNGPFLVKKIEEQEQTQNFASNLIKVG